MSMLYHLNVSKVASERRRRVGSFRQIAGRLTPRCEIGHAGINQTVHAMRQHYTWPGIKADVTAFIRQCHPCQVQRLATEVVEEPKVPKMSQPFEHVHIDLAGPFELKQVYGKATDVQGQDLKPVGRRRKNALSTFRSGTAYVVLIVDYFTKAAEFVAVPNKEAKTVARAFHDRWLMRYGVPEWVTSDNGREFAGEFAHQLTGRIECVLARS